MRRFLAAVCFIGVCVKTFAQCPFTVNAGPDTTICGNQSAYLHGSVNPVAGAYTYQWTPSATLTGSSTLTPVATPSGTTTYTLSVTAAGCTATSTITVTVSGVALLLTDSIFPAAPVCPGTLEQLKAAIIPNVCGTAPTCTSVSSSSVVGAGNIAQSGTQTSPPTLMGNYNNSGRNQILYSAAELTTALGGACTIDGIAFNIETFNSNAYLENFTISVACTNLTSLTTFNNNLIQVVNPISIQPSTGWNAFAFNQGYNWDGVSNLVVDVCWNDPGLNGSQNNKAQCTNTATNTYIWAFSNTADMCGTTVVPTATNERPNAKFGFCQPNINDYPIQWTPAIGANAVNKPDSSDPTANPTSSQAYTVSVTNGTCVSSATVNAVVDGSSVSAGPDISSCPGAAVTLNATVVGTIIPGPATFTWTTLAGGAVGTGASVVVNPVANTTYVVSMAGGACVHTDTVNVTLGSLNVVTAVTNVTCSGLNNGKIVVTASNGTPAYSYTWSVNANTGNLNTASNLAPGTYTVTASDINTCSGTATAIVTQPMALLNSSVIITALKCFGGNNATITIGPTGGTRPYSYSWAGGLSADSVQTGLVTGNYSVTTTDANGCTVATNNIPITSPAQITFGPAVIQNVRCPGVATGKITVAPTGGTGAYTYTWSANAPQVNSPTVTGLTSGTYVVTVTDANSCSASSSNAVVPASQMTFGNPTINSTKCFGSSDGSATVDPSGGTPPYTFLWTPSNQTTNPATGLSAQTYNVLVTDDSMCTANTTITVPQPGKIVIAAATSNVSCNGGSNGSINITSTTNAVNPLSFVWSNASTTQNVVNLSANTYYVTLTDANTCVALDTFIISQPTVLAVTLTPVNDLCFGASTGSITANATGGTGAYSYGWSNFATTQTISNLVAGPYSVIVTDANNCTATASATITQPASGPAFGNSVITNVLCNGNATGAITVTVNGGTPGYNYAWSANAPQINNATVTGLAAGIYTVTATDAGGCTVSGSNTVNQPVAITFAASQVISVSCHGGNDGSAQVNPSGGTGGNYTYTWNGVAGTDPEPGLAANTYTVVVTDANNCTASVSVVVGQPPAIQDSIVAENVLCFGGADGRLTAYAYGGNPPFSYEWGDGSTTQTDSDLAVQNTPFSVTITDSRGCTASNNATLTQPQAALSFTHSETQVSCPGKMDGTITAVGSGGTPPYSFSVTKDFANFVYINNSNIATGLDSGLYTIIFTDNNGCETSDTAFIKYPVPDSFSLQVDSTSCFGPQSADGSITVTAYTVNNMPYAYAIDNGTPQDTNYFGDLAAGPHQIVATNQFGCQTILDTVVAQPGPAFASILPSDTTLQLGQSITLQSSFGPYPLSSITSYNWVSDVGLSCIDCPYPVATPYSHVTQYILTITYNGLCTVSDSMQIIVQNQSKPFIPNSFTPNGDGNNDIFEIYGENIKTVKLRIFNRWGELVFESTNQFYGWDGYYKGVLQMPGVYTYDAQITFLDDTQTDKHGSITLIR